MTFLEDLRISFETNLMLICILRLTLATILGGIIGWGRQHTNSPAGLRTHEVVCIGATLCMILAEFMGYKYNNTIDPTKIGAQVISGIGFLGAGFYSGAIIATIFIYCTLIVMKRIMINHKETRVMCLMVEQVDTVYTEAREIFDRFKYTVYSTEIVTNKSGTKKEIRFLISIPPNEESFDYLKLKIRHIEGVLGQHME